LYEFMQEISSFPEHEIINLISATDTLMIYGGQSDFVKPEHHGIINKYFSRTKFELIENAGHWLHAEQPKKLMQALIKFISELKNDN